MKTIVIIGIIIAFFSMVSCVTAIPYKESSPLVQKININEKIRN